MYSNKMVVSLKSGSKFFKDEENGTVHIPFGTDYSIYLKNLESRRALVKISIDGKDVLSGHQLIIEPNSFLELEGYMKDNLVSNKFKFIKMTDGIRNHRGETPEDSLIRIEWDYELKHETIHYPVYIPYVYLWPSYPFVVTTKWDYKTTWSGTINADNQKISGWSVTYSNNNVNNTLNLNGQSGQVSNYYSSTVPVNDSSNGITVKGKDTHQRFEYGYVSEMENNPSTIVFKLQGFDGSQEMRPIYTKDKQECETCGRKNKANAKFCQECGTRLI